MTTTRWDETWHRLREWTNGPAPSERLAAQVLLSEGFTGLDPSHPLGGKDGGKDAVCARGEKRWVMAVYFPRGQQPFPAIKKKFSADLRGARGNGAEGFAFVTNQMLALAERQTLVRLGSSLEVELYHLERITTILDSPSLGPVREQFLGVALGEPGFSGSGLHQLLLRRFAYLTDARFVGMNWSDLVAAYRDLLSFVGDLHHGKHFAARLKRLIEPPWQSGSVGVLIIGGRQSVEEQRAEQEREAAATLMKVTESYRAQLAAARAAVAAELDEIILAQGAAPVASVATPRRRRPK